MVHHIATLPFSKGYGATVFFFGDLQFGVPGFDEECWDDFKSSFISTPNAWAVGLGDYSDWLRPSIRARLQGSVSGDDSARRQLDDKVRRSQDPLLKRMAFLEGKLIGLHSGHHEWEFLTGETSTQRLASSLKSPYLGWMASTRLRLNYGNKTSQCFIYILISMHGTGNSRFTTTDARWLEANIVPAWDADHYSRGHGCKSAAWFPFERNRIRRQGPAGVKQETPMCMTVGGFHRGYTDGHSSSYVEEKGFQPQPLSWGVLKFRKSHAKKDALINGVSCGEKHSWKGAFPTPTLKVEQAVVAANGR